MRLRLLRYLDRVTDRRLVLRKSRSRYRRRRGRMALLLILAALLILAGLLVAGGLTAQARGPGAMMEHSEREFPASP